MLARSKSCLCSWSSVGSPTSKHSFQRKKASPAPGAFAGTILPMRFAPPPSPMVSPLRDARACASQGEYTSRPHDGSSHEFGRSLYLASSLDLTPGKPVGHRAMATELPGQGVALATATAGAGLAGP